MNRDVGRLSHIIAAIKPTQKVSVFGYNENCGTDAVHCYDFTMSRNCQSSHNVNVANGNFLEKMSVFRENLHSGALVSAVANNVFSARTHHGNFTRVPKLSFIFSGGSELKLVGAGFFKHLNFFQLVVEANGAIVNKYLNPVIVGISNHYVLLETQAKSMRRVELAFSGA